MTNDPGTDVEAAYRASWDAYIAFGEQSTGDPPQAGSPPTTVPFPVRFREAMSPYFTEDQYDRLFDYFQVRALKGEELRGSVALAPKVVSATADKASLEDCFDDHQLGVYPVGGDTRTDQVTAERTLVTVELKRQDGRWKVARVEPRGRGCTPG